MKNNFNHDYRHARWLITMTCCILGFVATHAQSITWAFVNAAGFDDGENISLRWTMGEPLTYEVSSDLGSLRVGFLDFAYTDDLVSAAMTINPDITIALFPNPAEREMHIQLPDEKTYMIRILSLDGRSRLATDITSEGSVDIQSLPPGPYVLYAMDPDGTYNSITFIKS